MSKIKYLFHVPDGNLFLTQEEVDAKVKEILDACPSEHTCSYRVWYEGFEGCGMPQVPTKEAIERAIDKLPDWDRIPAMRFEKYGVVEPSYVRNNYDQQKKEDADTPMVLHQFHRGKHYKGPDGRIFWLAVIEVFDMRCFEWQDGKYIGQMVEIDPFSDYAKQMVEVNV
ncbi:MAG: hypothetical protein LUC19_05610 [Oscillospiraceae bacterium]|nr:hypothetical protein [Oscillospiraceae bacterium]MCC8078457.1 hypothetical protein [Oscillospiraceae bacterium]MCD7791984.1 hypothetical protein [Oscillospiraceae bacterium]MCD8017429.1 hypothetical protein [Oscillospiraceae bacterium]MCD8255059.1 hypothetical protein [Oscillospiraceae bacterium]